jgi:hypothetical protein
MYYSYNGQKFKSVLCDGPSFYLDAELDAQGRIVTLWKCDEWGNRLSSDPIRGWAGAIPSWTPLELGDPEMALDEGI